ncbi:hypothetical protein BDA96_03G123900 [Sorghum bicolor]|uniref:Uncharacterized protein n=2 Tax=Sorghum bicolor TaxID=4558 RepID=A0A921RDL2_SORBI|nr:hypothetical protein BDA96_03G123900 [Sorghum bicolor]KXG32206.1 hypothetical protein SORBI_3003G118800 [Sorghum bicolor]
MADLEPIPCLYLLCTSRSDQGLHLVIVGSSGAIKHTNLSAVNCERRPSVRHHTFSYINTRGPWARGHEGNTRE